MQQQIIDSHAHVFTTNLPVVPDRRYAPSYDATLEHYLTLLDQYRISRGVLVQPSFLGTDNEYLLQALEDSRGRCVGVAVVDPLCSADQLALLQQKNIRGVRLNLFGATQIDLRQTTWQQLFATLKALDMHVELHAPLPLLERYLTPILASGVGVVIDHFGRPQLGKSIDINQFSHLFSLRDQDQIYIKVSAIYRIFNQPDAQLLGTLLSLFMDTFSSKKLMWGSDWPHTQHEESTRFSDSIHWTMQHIQQQDRENVLYRTALDFYKIQGDDI